MPSPIRPTDDAARALARDLMAQARIAALGVLTQPGTPMVTRIAFGLSPAGQPLSLVSDLAAHTGALRANPACSLLVGEAGGRGDPLNQPRLTLQARAKFLPRDDPRHDGIAAHYLRDHPKAKLYISFADFAFVRFRITDAHLNGGFGKAFVLTPTDLGLTTA
ncbi:HugZ family protein [Sedimentitalea sp. HM32M-2]|uniref:HugZ family pyridoxamine 5'-phosphate oxidase n=1 Tax=Sedimentitalea sp. HM32M-2 TaxID=3351566 RepID=UPI0036260996